MVWIDDRWGMNTKEAIEAFKKMAECSHACGYSSLHAVQSAHAEGCNSKATGFCSYAEGYSSLHCVQPTVVEETSGSHEVQTTENVLEKIQKEIEEWLKDPGISCQAKLIDK